jgi:Uma2 family endonuclease
MGLPANTLSLSEFLDWENRQAQRHEFHHGEVFAMVGARRAHGRVVLNLGRRIAEALEGSPCQAFVENMKVQIAQDTVLYPDVFVTCDGADLATDMIFKAPSLVLEVLSPTTQAYDRSQKFALYRRLPSLREYVLVDPDTRRVEAFRRTEQGQWVLDDMSEAAELVLPCIDARIPMAQVFEGL